MGQAWSGTVLVPLVLTLVELVEADERWDIPCPGCGQAMSLHQPDEENPDHLLGTCDCGQFWVAIELISDGSAVILGLPTPNSLVRSVSVGS
jgi:hypothetical protein